MTYMAVKLLQYIFWQLCTGVSPPDCIFRAEKAGEEVETKLGRDWDLWVPNATFIDFNSRQ